MTLFNGCSTTTVGATKGTVSLVTASSPPSPPDICTCNCKDTEDVAIAFPSGETFKDLLKGKIENKEMVYGTVACV